MESHLLQMRGLKQRENKAHGADIVVASFTDAWIETQFALNIQFVALVASFTDAWIETGLSLPGTDITKSHLLQMRGLKQTGIARKRNKGFVASFTDAWIETFGIDKDKPANGSHLLQMRGLKQMRTIVRRYAVRRIFYRCVD